MSQVTTASYLGEELALPPFSPFDAEVRTWPYPVYNRYRSQDPVHWGAPAMPGLPGTWYLFGYNDIMAAIKDPRFSSERAKVMSAEAMQAIPPEMQKFLATVGRSMIFRDPPDHTRLRSLVNKAFTPQTVEKYRSRIQVITNELLDQIEANNSPADFIRNFAFPLPIVVITEMLGIPSEDREQFRAWSQILIQGVDMRKSPEVFEKAVQANKDFGDYLLSLFPERRQHPQADLISSLLQAEDNGGKLSEAEMLSMLRLLLVAGHETTVHLIGNGLVALLNHPTELEKLRTEPYLIENAVEELLRYDSPTQASARWVSEDMEFGGKNLHRGDNVYLVFGAGNHDPDQYRNPDQLDITRQFARHLSFGYGIHFCLGAPLARVEAQIAIPALLHRFPNLQLAATHFEWQPTNLVRGLKSLELSF